MDENLLAYIPMDRRHAMVQGRTLAEQTAGAALFADMSGFTELTEALVYDLGARRGAEELTTYLNLVYDALIDELHRWRGSAIAFAGDAVTAWFDDDDELNTGVHRAVTSALAMQRAMNAFKAIETPSGATVSLSMKAAIAAGPVRRFLVGNPQIRVIDALAGRTLERLAAAEHHANQGEVILSFCAEAALDGRAHISDHKLGEDGARYALVTGLREPAPPAPWPPLAAEQINAQQVRSWLLPAVYSRLQSGQGEFLAELRPAAALFVRFHGIDYDDDPEAGSKLDGFIRWVQSIVAHYQGTLVDLNIGDKGSYLYINFGAPIAHEDYALRAVSAARELQQIPAHLNYMEPVQIGLSQGQMRAGAYGGRAHRTYGVLGNQVNMAARLMMAARAGQTIASQELHRFVADQFVWAPLPTIRVKGMREHTSIYELIDGQQRGSSHLRSSGDLTPMIGRQQEQGRFTESLLTARQGKGQIVGVVGRPGIGKSRFIAECLHASRASGFAEYGGKCEAFGLNTSYLVWQPIWRGLLEVNPSRNGAEQLHELEDKLGAIDPTLRQRTPLLGTVLGLDLPNNDLTRKFDPELRKASLESLLTACLRALATEQPRLLILEDCHWLDALSHDLLEIMGRAITDLPILIVVAYRPLELERLRANRVSALPNYNQIELEELQPEELGQIARAQLSKLPAARAANGVDDALLKRIVQRAEGNPFYLEELIKFISYYGIDPSDKSALDKLELPSSLQSLVLSHIDQLGEREKTTLRAASIIGRSFRVGWLAGYYTASGGLAVVQQHLDQLQAFDITQPALSEPELTYFFRHILTYEVTYQSLPYATRANLHAQLAQFLETQVAAGALSESALLDALVHHYTQTDNLEKQRHYLQRASAAAFLVSAFVSALDYLTRLLALTPASGPGRSALERQVGDTHYRLGNYDAAQSALEKALATATADADRAAAQTLMAQITAQKGDFTDARRVLWDTMPLARTSGDKYVLCLAHYTLGNVNWRLGDMESAKSALEESLTLAQAIGDVTRELAARNGLGVLCMLTDGERSERLLKEVLRLARTVGNREREMIALANLGVLADERAHDDLAREYHLRAYTLACELGAQYYIAHYLSNLAGSEIALGDIDNAKAHNHEALALAHRLGTRYVMVQALCNTVEIAYAEGHPERALALVGLMRRQPAWSSEDTHWIDLLLAKWALDPVEAEAGMTRGDALDWETTVQDILNEQQRDPSTETKKNGQA